MKRIIVTTFVLALLAGFASASSGCSSSRSSSFQTTRENKPHVFRNRIHNPADYRYAEAE